MYVFYAFHVRLTCTINDSRPYYHYSHIHVAMHVQIFVYAFLIHSPIFIIMIFLMD